MKPALLSILFIASTVSFAETPQEVARRVIASETPGAYNPLNNTDAELNRAAITNSQRRLQTLMLGETVPDELRLCYALQVIERRLSMARFVKHPNFSEQLVRDREILAAHFRQLQDSK